MWDVSEQERTPVGDSGSPPEGPVEGRWSVRETGKAREGAV